MARRDQFTASSKQSMTAIIKDIEGKVRRACYEIVNIVEDFKTQRSPAASCVTPSLLYNSSCWVTKGIQE